jgi:uncharacterized protein
MPSQPRFARSSKDGLELRLKVVPGASSSEIAGVLGDRLKLRVASPPEQGQANKAVLKLLSTWLKPNLIELVTGLSSAEKTVLVRGLTELSEAHLGALK